MCTPVREGGVTLLATAWAKACGVGGTRGLGVSPGHVACCVKDSVRGGLPWPPWLNSLPHQSHPAEGSWPPGGSVTVPGVPAAPVCWAPPGSTGSRAGCPPGPVQVAHEQPPSALPFAGVSAEDTPKEGWLLIPPHRHHTEGPVTATVCTHTGNCTRHPLPWDPLTQLC